MIHDPSVEVTCEGIGCHGSVIVDHAGDTRDSEIEHSLVRDYEWIVRDGKHFCSPECAEEPKAKRGKR